MRWVLRFRVEDGEDYVKQLRLLEAVVGVPTADRKKLVIVPDLAAPTMHKIATDEEINKLAARVRFSDARKEAVKGVAGELGLDFTPTEFWAFFPHSVEEELARKELAYRNRHSDEIEQTIFRVTIREGRPEISVDDQVLKKSP